MHHLPEHRNQDINMPKGIISGVFDTYLIRIIMSNMEECAKGDNWKYYLPLRVLNLQMLVLK